MYSRVLKKQKDTWTCGHTIGTARVFGPAQAGSYLCQHSDEESFQHSDLPKAHQASRPLTRVRVRVPGRGGGRL